MSIRPILFNADMVRGILEDRKTVTRRVVKPQPVHESGFWKLGGAAWSDNLHEITPFPCHTLYNRAPYHPRDILYVRETFLSFDANHVINGVKYAYKADATPESERARKDFGYKWCPSIHMPREAARIFLRVTEVRVERLQDITPDQLRAEGMHLFCTPSECKNMMNRFGAIGDFVRKKAEFATIWDTTIKSADRALYGWDANPWVWVIEFERISREEAEHNA